MSVVDDKAGKEFEQLSMRLGILYRTYQGLSTQSHALRSEMATVKSKMNALVERLNGIVATTQLMREIEEHAKSEEKPDVEF